MERGEGAEKRLDRAEGEQRGWLEEGLAPEQRVEQKPEGGRRPAGEQGMEEPDGRPPAGEGETEGLQAGEKQGAGAPRRRQRGAGPERVGQVGERGPGGRERREAVRGPGTEGAWQLPDEGEPKPWDRAEGAGCRGGPPWRGDEAVPGKSLSEGTGEEARREKAPPQRCPWGETRRQERFPLGTPGEGPAPPGKSGSQDEGGPCRMACRCGEAQGRRPG